ncbi:MAG: tetratricopeptide repeat protein [Gammaproteobacteria bacterium]|nr:tetratricopeptide repeat protein [Gammaproteobacteria bacterium]
MRQVIDIKRAISCAVLMALLSGSAWAEPERAGWFDRWMAPYHYVDSASLRLRAATTRADLITAVQQELKTRGYYTGEPDGYTGPETQDAVRRFQEDAGVRPTGRIDSSLIDQLEQRAMLRPRFQRARYDYDQNTYSAIGDAQFELARMGYYDGPITGVLNPATRAAIRLYRSNPYNQPDVNTRAFARGTAPGYGFWRDYDTAIAPLGNEFEGAPATELAVDAELQQQCGLTALSSGDELRALQQSNAAIRGTDSTAQEKHCGFFTRGLVHLARNDAEAAIDDFSSVLRLAPESAEAYYNRALAYRDAGKPAFARRDLRQALRINPALANNAMENPPG